MNDLMEFAPSGPDFGPFSALSGPLSTILGYALALIGIIGLALVIIGLLRLVLSRGDIQKREAAKGNIQYGLVGVAVPLLFVFGLAVFQSVGEGVTS